MGGIGYNEEQNSYFINIDDKLAWDGGVTFRPNVTYEDETYKVFIANNEEHEGIYLDWEDNTAEINLVWSDGNDVGVCG